MLVFPRLPHAIRTLFHPILKPGAELSSAYTAWGLILPVDRHLHWQHSTLAGEGSSFCLTERCKRERTCPLRRKQTLLSF